MGTFEIETSPRGPYRVHPLVLRELAGVASRPSLTILEISQLSGELPGICWGRKKANIFPVFKKLFFYAILGS